MARPIKEGLDYFSLDCKLDDKIYMIEVELGLEGFALFIKLLMKIYGESYYTEWTERKAKIFSRQNNIDIEKVNKLIEICLGEGIFNQDIYKKYSILTSNGIQKRYFHSIKDRKEIVVIKEYLINGITDQYIKSGVKLVINSINPQINSIKPPHNTHSIVKDTIVKDSKEDIKESQAPSIKKEKELKKEVDPLEFSFTDKCWYGLDDWRIKMYQGKYPNLTINYLLQDVYKGKFLSDPLRYKKEIAIAGGVEKLVWMWLGQDEKYRKRKEKGG